MITAPFNFVPLSEKVFFPDWADKVSHDIPFEDAESGMIDITITAKSPIFIRNHSKDRDNPSSEFCNHNGQNYIPGSSIKGMTRSVLEIMSFSKMSIFNNDTYAVRDLNNKDLYLSKMKPQNIFCGWLRKKEGKYIIEDCGIPGRIRLDKINSSCMTRFYGQYDEKDDKKKTAKYKYELFSDMDLPRRFNHKKEEEEDNGKEIYLPGEDKEGTIVFTGQPSARIEGEEPDGKIYEFIFFEKKGELDVDELVFEAFKFAYFDNRKTQPTESTDWEYWKEKLEDNEPVPIFFQKNAEGEIEHFGLSYLYKLPYKYNIKHAVESISKEHLNPKADLAQTIFGYVNETEKTALKGRVQFSHFKADTDPEKFGTITTVLGTPRASYYPIYIKQNYEQGDIMVQDGRYNTLMGKKSKIAGRKRYPLHQKKPIPKRYGREVKAATTFTPIGAYDKEDNRFEEFTFSGKLRYHNLKKAELGAIISALTFHGRSEEFFHSIGMAKPYGFGKISISIDMEAEKQVEFLQAYERLMRDQIGQDWLETESMIELFSMASSALNIDGRLTYLLLDPSRGVDEFRERKNDKKYLPKISEITKNVLNMTSFLDEKTVQSFLETEDQKIALIRKKKQKTIEKETLLNKTPEIFSEAYKQAVEQYITKNCENLPKTGYDFFHLVLLDKMDDIIPNDIYNAYYDFVETDAYKAVEPLLIKRAKNKASEEELAELYLLLTKENTK